jgi:hypothetical protein
MRGKSARRIFASDRPAGSCELADAELGPQNAPGVGRYAVGWGEMRLSLVVAGVEARRYPTGTVGLYGRYPTGTVGLYGC